MTPDTIVPFTKVPIGPIPSVSTSMTRVRFSDPSTSALALTFIIRPGARRIPFSVTVRFVGVSKPGGSASALTLTGNVNTPNGFSSVSGDEKTVTIKMILSSLFGGGKITKESTKLKTSASLAPVNSMVSFRLLMGEFTKVKGLLKYDTFEPGGMLLIVTFKTVSGQVGGKARSIVMFIPIASPAGLSSIIHA